MHGRTEWTSASNIALIKYWGKHENQLPANASLSMTLRNSVSKTRVTITESANPMSVQFFFGGVSTPAFEPKIESFFTRISGEFPFLKHFDIIIESQNNFPHSAGIASSASAMSALALCVCELSGEFDPAEKSNPEFIRKASKVARLGSGSASRSVYGGFSVWGKTPKVIDSSDEWAVPLDFSVHEKFSKLQDAVLIVSSGKKKISSSEGHALMNTHPYATERYRLAEENLGVLLNALQSGNTDDFIRITENEALGLHSLMMSSDPGFMLIEAGTIKIINKIREFREKTGKFLCFTLDAGPNVHLLYPETEKEEVRKFILGELAEHCEGNMILWDEAGDGPERGI